MSRGLSNCNPGNIRRSKVNYKGEIHPSNDPHFKQFASLKWGYRAMFVLLDAYKRLHGLDTLRKMISRYAPPTENHTEAYIRAVSDFTGIYPDEPIDTHDRCTMVPIVAAMSKVENGVMASMRDVEQGWELTRFDCDEYPPKENA